MSGHTHLLRLPTYFPIKQRSAQRAPCHKRHMLCCRRAMDPWFPKKDFSVSHLLYSLLLSPWQNGIELDICPQDELSSSRSVWTQSWDTKLQTSLTVRLKHCCLPRQAIPDLMGDVHRGKELMAGFQGLTALQPIN